MAMCTKMKVTYVANVYVQMKGGYIGQEVGDTGVVRIVGKGKVDEKGMWLEGETLPFSISKEIGLVSKDYEHKPKRWWEFWK